MKKMIISSFLYEIKYIFLIAITCLVSTYIFSAYCTMQETNLYNERKDIKQDYGKYVYRFVGLNENELELIKNDEYADSFFIIKENDVEIDNEIFSYLSVSEDFFDYTNYCIIDGKFPQKEDEVMVPKWYLFHLGISVENMIGSEIELKNPDTDKFEKKRISGIVVRNDNNEIASDLDTGMFVIFNEKYVNYQDGFYNIYVETSNFYQLEEHINEVASYIYEKSENIVEYDLNYPLLNILGHTEMGKQRNYHRLLLYFVVSALIIFLILIVFNNVIMVCLLKWKTILKIYQIIGANMHQINMNIIAIFFCVISVCTVLGNILGIGSVYLISKLMLDLEEVVPGALLCLESVLEIIALMLMLYLKLKKYNDFNHEYRIRMEGNGLDGAGRLFRSEKRGIIKLSFRNFMFYNRKKVISIVSIACCILFLFLMGVQLRENVNQLDSNDGYRYYFEVDDYYKVMQNASDSEVEGVKKVYHQICDMCEKNNILPYYNTEFVTEYSLKKDYLSQDYRDMLTRTTSGNVQLLNHSDYIDTTIVIMGYSKQMIEQMNQTYDLNINGLSQENAIILSRTTNKDGNGGNTLLSMIGEKVNVDTIVFQDTTQDWITNTYHIVGEVDDLLVYPRYDKNSVCLIIDIDQYNKYFNNDFISSFYTKDIDDIQLGQLQRIIEGNNYIRIKDLKDENATVKLGYLQRILLMGIILGIACLFAVMNIHVQNVFEFDYRRNQLKLFRIIGMSDKNLFIMIGLESAYIFILGFVIGVMGCKVSERILYNLCLISKSAFHGEFIILGMVITILFMAISIALTCKNVKKEIDMG